MITKRAFFLIITGFFSLYITAQKTGNQSLSMKHGETVEYDLYFKWGFLMRAGDAVFEYKPDKSVEGATSHYKMNFKTAKFFDGFYKMRDTIDSYFNDNKIIYSRKITNEGSYYDFDELKFNYDTDIINIHSKRRNLTRVKVDTVLTTVDEVTDLLGVIHYIRGINRNTLKFGEIYPLTVAIGRDLVKVQFIYQNPQIVEHGNMKFKTHYFKIDVFDDDAFESTKTAVELWVGDDDNFLPIKVRSKLKFGYVEIYYKSSTGLAHPLSCGVSMKK